MKKATIHNILFIIGLAAVIIMLFTFEVSFRQLWADICRAGYWLFAVIGLWLVLYVMNALTWLVILRESGEVPISFARLLKITISGFALNSATPVGLLGGEPYKIMEMTPVVGSQRATSSVVLFAMMHIFSHFWFWLTGVVLYLLVMPLQSGIAVLLALVVLLCFAGIYLFVKGYKNGMMVKLIRALCHIPGCRNWAHRFADSHAESLQRIDSQIAALMSQSRRSFYLSLALEYIGRMMQALEIFFMLLIFDTGGASFLTYIHCVLILAFTSLFANMLFFIPMQMGGREGGFAMSTAQMGMTNEIGLFISIISRVRELFWMAVGLALIKVCPTKDPSPTQ